MLDHKNKRFDLESLKEVSKPEQTDGDLLSFRIPHKDNPALVTIWQEVIPTTPCGSQCQVWQQEAEMESSGHYIGGRYFVWITEYSGQKKG